MIELLAEGSTNNDWTIVGALLGIVSLMVTTLVWVVKQILKDSKDREKQNEKREERAGQRETQFLESIRRNNDRLDGTLKEFGGRVEDMTSVGREQIGLTREMRDDIKEMKIEIRDYNDTNSRRRGDGP